MISYNN